MVRALISTLSGLGWSLGRGHCAVFLGKTLNSHSASHQPGVKMGLTSHSGRGVEIKCSYSLHATEHWDKLQSDGPLGSYADLIIYTVPFIDTW